MTSETWETLYNQMVDRLLQQKRIRTPRVEEAFRMVPRHIFLPGIPLDRIYSGDAIATRHGPNGLPISSSSEPAVMAVMLEQLQVQPGNRVLEVGAGTGYNAALLAHLAGREGEVTTIDIDEDIVDDARQNLVRAGFPAVRVIARDGWFGAEEHAPYHRIEATVGAWDLSPSWFNQLTEGGILVVPLWLRAGVQASVAFRKHGNRLESVSVEPAGFMRLRGPHAGPESYVRVGVWIVNADAAEPEKVTILRELVESDVREEPAPPAAHWWGTRLFLEDPQAISMQHADDHYRSLLGIFDPGARSLAAVEYRRYAPTRLLVFGEHSARDRLLRFIVESQPLDLRELKILAVSSKDLLPDNCAWVIPRPNFHFAVFGSPA